MLTNRIKERGPGIRLQKVDAPIDVELGFQGFGLHVCL